MLSQQLETIVREAGDIILNAKRPQVTQKEGHYNFVTQTDVQVQEFLRGELLRLLPGSKLLAEEQENQRLGNEPTWIVDPIDGTINFMRGRDFSAVSVALMEWGVPVLGVVYNPFTREMYTAKKGEGAQLNGQPIQVSDLPFDKALVTIGTSPYNPALAVKNMRAATQALLTAGDLRRSGSAALDLCWVASGRSELYFEFQVSPWDYAAGALILTEAGGQVYQPLDDGFDFGRTACLLGTNPPCAQEALKLIRDADEGRLAFQ